jgi:hypothetical protein
MYAFVHAVTMVRGDTCRWIWRLLVYRVDNDVPFSQSAVEKGLMCFVGTWIVAVCVYAIARDGWVGGIKTMFAWCQDDESCYESVCL